jgi:hypothetical protein
MSESTEPFQLRPDAYEPLPEEELPEDAERP